MSAAANTTGAPRPQRHSRGKRPRFYATPGLDDAMSMILVLAQELSVLRDRVDSIERVSARHGIDLAKEIESLELDQAALDAREARRQQLLERLYYLSRKEADELAAADSKQRYDQVIEETAQA
jgi:parvulin-like peptidyl-prolyl isomerase